MARGRPPKASLCFPPVNPQGPARTRVAGNRTGPGGYEVRPPEPGPGPRRSPSSPGPSAPGSDRSGCPGAGAPAVPAKPCRPGRRQRQHRFPASGMGWRARSQGGRQRRLGPDPWAGGAGPRVSLPGLCLPVPGTCPGLRAPDPPSGRRWLPGTGNTALGPSLGPSSSACAHLRDSSPADGGRGCRGRVGVRWAGPGAASGSGACTWAPRLPVQAPSPTSFGRRLLFQCCDSKFQESESYTRSSRPRPRGPGPPPASVRPGAARSPHPLPRLSPSAEPCGQAVTATPPPW